MASNQKTSIPAVPKNTPMFDGPDDTGGDKVGDLNLGQLIGKILDQLKLNRTWLMFFEKVPKATGGGAGPFQRTILIKDTTVGNDIADHVTVYGNAVAPRNSYGVVLITGVLRKTIASALTLRINVVYSNLTSAVVGTFTIPSATKVNAAISFNLKILATKNLPDKGVLTWDVTASDGSKDNAGVASFTIEWQ